MPFLFFAIVNIDIIMLTIVFFSHLFLKNENFNENFMKKIN